jgi:hypothetical protein
MILKRAVPEVDCYRQEQLFFCDETGRSSRERKSRKTACPIEKPFPDEWGD